LCKFTYFIYLFLRNATFLKNVSVLYPLSEIDAYSADMFSIAEIFGRVYSIYAADILAIGTGYSGYV